MRRQRGENTLSSRNMPFGLKKCDELFFFPFKSHPDPKLDLGLHPDPIPDLGLKIQIFENSMKFLGEF